MTRYLPKRIAVEAWQLSDDMSNWRELEALDPKILKAIGNWKHKNDALGIRVKKLPGANFASPGDWIVRDSTGIWSICWKEEFDNFYEPELPPDAIRALSPSATNVDSDGER